MTTIGLILIWLAVLVLGAAILDQRKTFTKLEEIEMRSISSLTTIKQDMDKRMDGFVSKSSPLSEIPLAIDSVANGVPFYGRDISILIRDITDAKLNNKNIAALSKREIEIIKACCDGLMGKEIADKFHISLRAVNSHKTNIFNKLGLSSSVEMVRFAIEHGII